ncbi:MULTISPECIES: hypothetical protein [unclassified Neisseria]|uniref:hypothetical protein n=1 Tax=unclassified Neisseria TaxID=2623750 RepID=UPI0026668C87|nr:MULTISPECIES: hypothetical protein [unclassified Neisseria]MDO1510913.1 hypothetical protein [Neisseria sp. MVDL19-042950]MDO1516864.1 hypothetical protein [Neisseria sp. MVDL18-041461]MDO1563924.1 hypothetical protein [Neisseria sp. MVDL20-010259]
MEKYKKYKILVGLLLISLSNFACAQQTVDNKFQIDGFNGIGINSKFNSKRLKKELEHEQNSTCFIATDGVYKNVSYMVDNDIVVTIGTDDRNISSPFNVKIGDSLKVVYQKHFHKKGIRLENPYSGFSIVYWHPNKIGVKYNISNNKVESFEIGSKGYLELMEGCS